MHLYLAQTQLTSVDEDLGIAAGGGASVGVRTGGDMDIAAGSSTGAGCGPESPYGLYGEKGGVGKELA